MCVFVREREREKERQTGREHRVVFTLGEECVCVCVCVCERERERERERRERDKGRESKGEEGGGAGGMATVIQEGGWPRIFSLSQFLCVFAKFSLPSRCLFDMGCRVGHDLATEQQPSQLTRSSPKCYPSL